VVLVADLMALGATAGLGIRSSLEAAAGYAGAETGEDAAALLRAMDRRGVAAALAAEEGRLSGVARVLAGAAASGAPPAAALSAFAATRRHEQHAARLERARRLPVRMLLPLALLILPGFVVLAVGPAIFEGLARLGPLP